MAPNANLLQRAFLALWPSAQGADALRAAVQSCCGDRHGSMVATADLHCTLVFLGDVTADRYEQLGTALDAVAGTPFKLTFDVVEHWPAPRIIVACPHAAPAALLDLQRSLVAATHAAGLPTDPRPFRPHVTMRRNQLQCCATLPIGPCSWELDQFVLACSGRGDGDSKYRVLRHWRLRPD